MSRQVEERRIQDGEPSRSEMDDVRGAISAGLELGGPPRMSVGAKERTSHVRGKERIYLSRREMNDVGDREEKGTKVNERKT